VSCRRIPIWPMRIGNDSCLNSKSRMLSARRSTPRRLPRRRRSTLLSLLSSCLVRKTSKWWQESTSFLNRLKVASPRRKNATRKLNGKRQKSTIVISLCKHLWTMMSPKLPRIATKTKSQVTWTPWKANSYSKSRSNDSLYCCLIN